MKITKKNSSGFLVVFSIVTLMGIGSVFAENTSDNITSWRGGPHVGLSLYTGVIGADIQKDHFSLTIGVPASLGIRYYLDERGSGWFFGAHATYFTLDEEETEDGIRYDNQDTTIAGLGLGYKWRWADHWDLTVNLSIAYLKEELENDFVYKTDEYILPLPGIAIGYSF